MKYIAEHPTVSHLEPIIRQFQIRKLGFTGDEKLRDLRLDFWQDGAKGGQERAHLSELITRLRDNWRRHSGKKSAVKAVIER